MGKIIKIVLAVCILMVVYSCCPTNPVWRVSTIKYGDSDDFINRMYINEEDGVHDQYLIFYSDGTFLKDSPDWVCSYYKIENADTQTSLQLIDRYYKKNKRAGEWGIYKKENNDIIVEMYVRHCFFYHDWEIIKEHYKLENDSIISLRQRTRTDFSWRGVFPLPVFICTEFERDSMIYDGNRKYKLAPQYKFPDENYSNYVKKKKWAWRNVTDWEKWKSQMKDNKSK